MFKKTKGYANGGMVKGTKYMAKGGAMKGTKYMSKGGAMKIDDDPEYKKLKEKVILAKEERDKTSVLKGRTAQGPRGAIGSGKNIPYWKAKRELKKFVKENKATLKERGEGSTKRY
jgi:hypothetical protein